MRLLTPLLALTAACSAATEPSIGGNFRLDFGEAVSIPEAALWLHFVDVPEDSRCPLEVQCVWAGDAAIAIEIAPGIPGGDSITDTLHTTLDPKSLDLGSYVLHLVRVDPSPKTPGTIPLASYHITLRLDSSDR